MRSILLLGLATLILAVLPAASSPQQGQLILDEPLQGSTSGTRNGGAFQNGGWQVTGTDNYIYWHLPAAVTAGTAEFHVRGIRSQESRPGTEDKSEFFHMYDWTFQSADTNYTGYRNNPFKHALKKTGTADTRPGKTDAMETLWKINDNYTEPDTSVLSWDPNHTYVFREVWGPDGAGNSVIRTYRDGQEIMTMSVPGTWNPAGHSVRIGVARLTADSGAPVDAVFSNVKVWSGGQAPPPPPPPPPPGTGRTGNVRLVGNTLVDDGGAFLGLGVSYMTALRRCKYDRARLHSDLSFLSQRGYNYYRMLSMVGWYEAWNGLEIAPVSFTTRDGRPISAWGDYGQQLSTLIDIAYDQYGMRTQITIFADAQLMPDKSSRIAHMDGILQTVSGRQHKIMHLEVANEAWQNGFPDPGGGTADLREFCQYLADRTSIPVAITSNHDADMAALYQGSAADIATWHFSRDKGPDDGWVPVYHCWQVEDIPNFPPASSNEPIGPGSSVASENDPIKLVMAAAFAYAAKLPMYVFHSDAGVFGHTRFEDKPAVGDYARLLGMLPGDLPSWARNDGKEAAAPFTAFAGGQANRYWPEVGANDGCVRNIGGRKNSEFVCVPIGIRPGGLTLEARQALSFKVYHPLTGQVVDERSMNAGDRFTLPQGPGGYIITNASVTPPGPGAGSLRGEYYDNADFTGTSVVRNDSLINFDWGTGSPVGGVGPDTFSVRWTGRIRPAQSETYTFYTVSDDGVRLWVNGQLIIDNWTDHAPTENSGMISLQAGLFYDFKLEFYENGVGAMIQLSVSSPSVPKQIVPASAFFPPVLSALATGWEDGEPLGPSDQVLYLREVNGPFNSASPPPECSRRSGETWRTGTHALMVSGYSNAPYAYCYYKLFDDDLLILPGTKLTYWIWHESTPKVAVDGHFTDGGTLRDGGFADQNGVALHPGQRSEPLGAWHYVEVDLSAAAGRTLDFLLIGFDNASDGFMGPYRAYVDDLTIGPNAGGPGGGGDPGGGGGGGGSGGGGCGATGLEALLLAALVSALRKRS